MRVCGGRPWEAGGGEVRGLEVTVGGRTILARRAAQSRDPPERPAALRLAFSMDCWMRSAVSCSARAALEGKATSASSEDRKVRSA